MATSIFKSYILRKIPNRNCEYVANLLSLFSTLSLRVANALVVMLLGLLFTEIDLSLMSYWSNHNFFFALFFTVGLCLTDFASSKGKLRYIE